MQVIQVPGHIIVLVTGMVVTAAIGLVKNVINGNLKHYLLNVLLGEEKRKEERKKSQNRRVGLVNLQEVVEQGRAQATVFIQKAANIILRKSVKLFVVCVVSVEIAITHSLLERFVVAKAVQKAVLDVELMLTVVMKQLQHQQLN